MRAMTALLALVSAATAVIWLSGTVGMQQAVQWIANATDTPYNTLVVLLGTGTLGLAAGVVGSFAVLRRRSLVGDAVAHSALPGLAIAFMVVGDRHFGAMLLGAFLTGLLGAVSISWLEKNTRIKADAAIAFVLSVLFGLGVVLSRIVQDNPSGRQEGLDSFLLGKTAGMVSQDLLLVTNVAIVLVATVLLFYKEFKLISFDPQFASVLGLPVLSLDIVLMVLLVGVTIIGLPAVGVVLMAALLIIPGVSARFWTDRLHVMVILAAIFGLATGWVGTWISAAHSDLPAGPVIVLTGSAIFTFSMIAAPKRGILMRSIRLLRNSLRIAYQNLLRTMYEISESAGGDDSITLDRILRARAMGRATAVGLLLFTALRKEVHKKNAHLYALTESGRAHAEKIVRAHRLWEIFLVEQASIAPDHVHRDADDIEHALTPELIALLESRQDPGGSPTMMPASVHAIREEG